MGGTLINQLPNRMDMGKARVFKSPSSSRPGLFHYTLLFDTGTAECSCEGYSYNQHCRHIDQLPAPNKGGSDE
jgi:hypothetical protein